MEACGKGETLLPGGLLYALAHWLAGKKQMARPLTYFYPTYEALSQCFLQAFLAFSFVVPGKVERKKRGFAWAPSP